MFKKFNFQKYIQSEKYLGPNMMSKKLGPKAFALVASPLDRPLILALFRNFGY